MIEFGQDGVQIDAVLVGEALEIDPSLVQDHMRRGRITSQYERGIDEDAGRHRLTFFYESRRLSLIVDDAGNVIQRSFVDFGDRPVPKAMRRLPPPQAEGEE